MSRARRASALPALAVAAVATVLLSGCGSGNPTAGQPAKAPDCLPSKLLRTARLAGTAVDVSPAPGAQTASPDTQISFLGVPAAEIQDISVVGARSGNHTGRLERYSQGDGGSFLPKSPFDSNEQVVVHALIGAPGAGKRVAFSFHVDTPYPTENVPPFANPQAAPSEYETFPTLPGTKAPVLRVTVLDRDPAAGDILTTNGPGPGAYGPLIYTPQGRLVWFDQLSGGETAENLNVQTYEGQRDVTFWQGKVLDFGFGQGEDIVMNSHYETVARVHGGNGLHADLHEFRIAPQDVAYITAFNPIRCNLAHVEGGPGADAITDTAIQEIDLKTGLVRWEWHSLDHIAVSESKVSPPAHGPYDWFHINSIDPESDGNILISARSTWAAYQLEGGSGTILWRLGGLHSSFKLGPGTETAWQHDAQMLPNGEVSMFDDGAAPPVHAKSRGVRIKLDFKTHEATLTSEYSNSDPPLLAASQGNLQPLLDGNVLIDYGGVPEISEYTGTGAVVFDAHLPYNMISYRGYRAPWSARPSQPPAAVANLNNTAEETIVHASWNGATGVAAWRVLAGAHRGSLAQAATISSTGFESSTILPEKYAYVAVQALDAAGQRLGTSPTVAVESYAASLPPTGSSK